jgi:hypothetical protein
MHWPASSRLWRGLLLGTNLLMLAGAAIVTLGLDVVDRNHAVAVGARDDTPAAYDPDDGEDVGRPQQPQPTAQPDGRRAIEFAGYAWRVRAASELQGPGPNYFSEGPDHVWVDEAGQLHLRVAPDADGRWQAAEIASEKTLGYGTYQFVVSSRLDDLDPNVVLGLFTWSDDPAQDHREVDVEFGRFGQQARPIGRYTRQPYTEPDNVYFFEQPSSSTTTQRIDWRPDQLTLSSWDAGPESADDPDHAIARHTFTGTVPDPGDAKVHLNLWLDAGRAPTDGQPVEIVIRDFSFSPSATQLRRPAAGRII